MPQLRDPVYREKSFPGAENTQSRTEGQRSDIGGFISLKANWPDMLTVATRLGVSQWASALENLPKKGDALWRPHAVASLQCTSQMGVCGHPCSRGSAADHTEHLKGGEGWHVPEEALNQSRQ